MISAPVAHKVEGHPQLRSAWLRPWPDWSRSSSACASDAAGCGRSAAASSSFGRTWSARSTGDRPTDRECVAQPRPPQAGWTRTTAGSAFSPMPRGRPCMLDEKLGCSAPGRRRVPPPRRRLREHRRKRLPQAPGLSARRKRGARRRDAFAGMRPRNEPDCAASRRPLSPSNTLPRLWPGARLYERKGVIGHLADLASLVRGQAYFEDLSSQLGCARCSRTWSPRSRPRSRRWGGGAAVRFTAPGARGRTADRRVSCAARAPRADSRAAVRTFEPSPGLPGPLGGPQVQAWTGPPFLAAREQYSPLALLTRSGVGRQSLSSCSRIARTTSSAQIPRSLAEAPGEARIEQRLLDIVEARDTREPQGTGHGLQQRSSESNPPARCRSSRRTNIVEAQFGPSPCSATARTRRPLSGALPEIESNVPVICHRPSATKALQCWTQSPGPSWDAASRLGSTTPVRTSR